VKSCCRAIKLLVLLALASCALGQDDVPSRIFLLGAGQVRSIAPQTDETMEWGVEGTHAAVSPDGREVAYVQENEGKASVVISDGVRSRQVVSLPFATEAIRGHMAWSDDGRWLALLVALTSEPFHEQLMLVDMERGQWKFVTGPVTLFAWRPGSRQIAAFPAGVDSGIGLYLIDPMEETWVRLLHASYVGAMTWAPDGERIALSRPDSSHTFTEWVLVDMKSRALTSVYSDTFPILRAAWSPDGKWIACCQGGGDIVLVHPESGQVSRLSSCCCQGPLAWSPDSREIVYLRRVEGGVQLVELNVVEQRENVWASGISPGVDEIVWP